MKTINFSQFYRNFLNDMIWGINPSYFSTLKENIPLEEIVS